MQATTPFTSSVACALFACSSALHAGEASLHDWQSERAEFDRLIDHALYEMPAGDTQERAFELLEHRATELTRQFPNRAEPLALHGWSLATHAKTKGRTLAGIKLGGASREKLEAAIALDAKVYGADVYAALGSLCLAVADIPIAFGYKTKARNYLKKALSIDPTGIEQNLRYGELLATEKDYPAAIKHATLARNAPPNIGRERTDAELRALGDKLIAHAKAKIR